MLETSARKLVSKMAFVKSDRKRYSTNSESIKRRLFKHLKCGKGYNLVVSEFVICGPDREDIVAIGDNEIIAVEIKTSKRDFLNDFKKAKYNGSQFFSIVNKFYFCVPESLCEFVESTLKERGLNNIGVLKASERAFYISSQKRATPYKNTFNSICEIPNLIGIIKRAGSELANLYEKLEREADNSDLTCEPFQGIIVENKEEVL